VTIPSIKGTAFQSVVDDIQSLLDAGRLSREELEARLTGEDLEILDGKVNPTTWSPIDTYKRAVEVLARKEAPLRTEEYLVERGVKAAERLSALGIYSQLEATSEHMGVRVGKVIVTISRAIYNFTCFHYEPGDDGVSFSIRVEDAAAFPEAARFATQGFVEYVASRAAGYAMHVTSERPSPDVVVYRARQSS
jgi:hypothetical protein